ncbi:MAG: cyclic nucleotide-binding domain-containing protein [Myxococcales bacterium]|nr:cyclic nucleotide-binding domain-containing protein [Myxococcales bacterium]
MKIVIAGGGRVGAALAARLVAERHLVTVIDRERAVCERIFQSIGAVTVVGDATDPHSLEEAGIGGADVAAGVLARDADNLAFAMLVRSLSAARLMVRMLDDSYRQPYRLAGVRDVVAEAQVVVGKIATAIEFPEVAGSLPLARGDAILFELPIVGAALVAGKTVAQVRATDGFPRECVFIGLVDADGRIDLPSGATVLKPGLTAILVARREQLPAAVSFLTARTSAAEAVASVVRALKSIDFLAPLSEEELAKVSRGVELVRRAEKEVVFRQGEPGEAFYVVLSGEVTLTREGVAVETIKGGGFFGEISLLTGEARTNTAVAATECELAAIGREDFREVVMANPAVALEMSRILGQRLASAARSEAQRRRRGLFGR